jgi:hypothetical protein
MDDLLISLLALVLYSAVPWLIAAAMEWVLDCL